MSFQITARLTSACTRPPIRSLSYTFRGAGRRVMPALCRLIQRITSQIYGLNEIPIGFIISGMSKETTQNLPDGRSFEERVFARLDSIDSRLQSLEQQAERRAVETKPIWERALAEILEVKERLGVLEQLTNQMVRKVDVLGKEMLTLRADQAGVEGRLEKLESRPV